MTVTRRLAGSRLVEIRFGDTLQTIAARELGDASKWADLIAINDLVYPYLTGEPSEAGESVLLYGSLIVVPATVAASAETDPDAVFGTDIALTRGELTAVAGDLAVVSGRANLRQAIKHRLGTAWNELLFHLNYGLGVYRLMGTINGPTAGALAAEYVRGAMLSDPRIAAVPVSVAEVQGDRIAVTATINPVTGSPVSVSEVL